jgi:uncharacterized protein (DUF302 family)
MFRKFMLAGLLLALIPTVQAAGGMITLQSAHPVAVTVDRLATALEAAGFRIFARVDHGAGARSVDMALPPTELLIFGKPRAGTVLMQAGRTVGIDLPLKYLVWEDAEGRVQLGWNDPAWMVARHGIAPKAPPVANIAGALRKIASEAAQ